MQVNTVRVSSNPVKPSQPIIRDSVATLRQSVASGLFPQQSTIELLSVNVDELLDELVNLKFSQADALLSRHPDLENVNNEEEHQLVITRIYWTLLKGLLDAYAQSEMILRQHLQEIIYGLYIFASTHGIEFKEYQHTELVIFMTPLNIEKALGILKSVPEIQWSERSHAMAYHLEWRQGNYYLQSGSGNV
jgi:hypothetical protein